jgi:hypothetical protein
MPPKIERNAPVASVTEFGSKLHALMRQGNMTTADAVLWFERPYATVYSWAWQNNVPRFPYDARAWARLHLLEHYMRRPGRKLIPLDDNLSQKVDRGDTVRKALADALKRFPQFAPKR